MYYELYIDLFFLENLFLDFLLLLLTGIMGKLKWKWQDLGLVSFFGSTGACLFVIIPIRHWEFWLAGQVGISVLMIKWGFHLKKKRLWKTMILFYGIAFLLGGILEAMDAMLTLPVTLAGILGTFWILGAFRLKERWKCQTQNIYQVTLVWNGVQKELKGLRDTGNQLRDPYFKRPVTVAEYDAVKELFNQKTKVLWIPYHSIGKPHGWMPGIQLDYLLMQTEEGQRKIEHPIVAISKERVSVKGRYQLILPDALTDD